MLKTAVTITCDGNRYTHIEDRCGAEIDSTDIERCIGVECTDPVALTFYPWQEDAIEGEGILHFHNSACASGYLGQWLKQQRTKLATTEAPAEYTDPIPAITTIAGGAQ